MVSFLLRQVTSLVDQAGKAPLYRVINQVTESTGASAAVFAYKTATKVFDHYANAGEMEQLPDSYEEAVVRGVAFYRLNSVSRDWETVAQMYADIDATMRRVRSLAKDLTQQQGAIVMDRSTSIVGA